MDSPNVHGPLETRLSIPESQLDEPMRNPSLLFIAGNTEVWSKVTQNFEGRARVRWPETWHLSTETRLLLSPGPDTEAPQGLTWMPGSTLSLPEPSAGLPGKRWLLLQTEGSALR